MPIEEHADYLFEKRRLEDTINYVNLAIEENIEKKQILKEDIKEVSADLDNLDNSQSYERFALNTALHDMAGNEYIGLIKARSKPYFCRIDIRQDNNEVKNFYIGKMGLTGDDIENPLIVDWRAPIAGVYYDGRLGHVTYSAPGGIQNAELYLKRQYTINKAILENFIDVDITATDTFLQAALGENKDKRLQDIVSTIQAEQNEIIRADIYSPIIVQGVAGSGKTTIALHRIAYLIYTFSEAFHPYDFLIIAPNSLFLNYISEVLPELGVENVKQSTFINLASELLKIKYNLINSDEKLIKFISHNNNSGDKELLRRICKFKCSLKFRDIIDKYAEYIENEFIPGQDFILGEYTILAANDIRKIFNKALSYLPLYKRIPMLKIALSGKIKEEAAVILKKTDEFYEQQIQYIRNNAVQDQKEKLIALFDERDDRLKIIKRAAKTAAVKYLSFLPDKDLMSYYKELITDPEKIILFSGDDSPFTVDLCEHNTTLFRNDSIEFEDLTALIYLKYKLFGFDDSIEAKYIVIDEAQDFSLFQIYVLKEIFHTELFTLLGDLAQGIHSYRGIKDWNDIFDKLFSSKKCRYMTLEMSYRTTVEIMNAANEILKICNIPGLVPANPVVRYGDKPHIYRFGKTGELIRALGDRVNYLKSKQYKTIAVICKTAGECSEIKSLLDKSGITEVRQLNADDISYEGGIVILPSYLAKGLEFDAVIVCTLSEDYYLEELDLKLLYVVMTRALHCLDFMCMDGKMKILDGTAKELWA